MILVKALDAGRPRFPLPLRPEREAPDGVARAARLALVASLAVMTVEAADSQNLCVALCKGPSSESGQPCAPLHTAPTCVLPLARARVGRFLVGFELPVNQPASPSWLDTNSAKALASELPWATKRARISIYTCSKGYFHAHLSSNMLFHTAGKPERVRWRRLLV